MGARILLARVMSVEPLRDETTYTITKTLNGLVFLLDAGGVRPGQGHSCETFEGIARGYPGRRCALPAAWGVIL